MNIKNFPVLKIDHLIPQKTPFVMVDSLLDFSETKVISSYRVKKDNLFFKNDS